MIEIWKDIPGHKGLYQASNTGRIKSLNYGRTGKEKLLKLQMNTHGYLAVDIKQKKYSVHRLILLTFIGKSDLECNHKNGIKTDNRLENLEYCTSDENQKHAIMLRLNNQNGINNSQCKLTISQVKQVKWIYKNSILKWGDWTKIAKYLKIAPSTISDIIHNRKWKCI